jgi:hypothetical protein
MPFTSGTFHQNRKGFYVVVAVNGARATIRYQDGTTTTSDIAALERIEMNLLREQAFKEKQRMQFMEACEYLSRYGIPFNPQDLTGVFLEVNEHKESKRLVELHHRFLIRKGIAVQGRSLVAVAADIQKVHRSTRCYGCKSSLNNFLHLECSACGWIMCPNCGACGCGYSK